MRLAIFTILTVFATACVAGEPSTEIVLSNDSGKFDQLDGKRLSIRPTQYFAFFDEVSDSDDDSTTSIVINTDDKAVLKGTSWYFDSLSNMGNGTCDDWTDCESGSECDGFCRERHYGADHILRLEATGENGPMALIVSATYADAGAPIPVDCLGTNVFGSIDLDFYDEEVITDGAVYSFEDCGLLLPRSQETYKTLSITAFPIPFDLSTGRVGQFRYTMWAGVL